MANQKPEYERVKSVSAEMWLTPSSEHSAWWNFSLHRPNGYNFQGTYRFLCAEACEHIFGAKLDPDAPPRRVRVTIELVDE